MFYLLADTTFCALKEQTTPDGYYNIGRMVRRIGKQGKIGACGTCMDARGLSILPLLDGVQRSTIDELTSWILASEKVISF